MIGVTASAGAQLDFSTLTVAGYSLGKGFAFGFRAVNGGSSSMSNTTLEQGNNTTLTCTGLEDQGSVIVYVSSGLPSSKPSIEDSFRRIIIDDLILNQADTNSYSNSTGYGWNTSDDAFSSNTGTTIIIQLRAD